jgi:hypothetical protein
MRVGGISLYWTIADNGVGAEDPKSSIILTIGLTTAALNKNHDRDSGLLPRNST